MRELLSHPTIATAASHFALSQVKYTTALPVLDWKLVGIETPQRRPLRLNAEVAEKAQSRREVSSSDGVERADFLRDSPRSDLCDDLDRRVGGANKKEHPACSTEAPA